MSIIKLIKIKILYPMENNNIIHKILLLFSKILIKNKEKVVLLLFLLCLNMYHYLYQKYNSKKNIQPPSRSLYVARALYLKLKQKLYYYYVF